MRSSPGRLRRLAVPAPGRFEQRLGALLYPVFDPDGTVLRDEDLTDLTTPDVGADVASGVSAVRRPAR